MNTATNRLITEVRAEVFSVEQKVIKTTNDLVNRIVEAPKGSIDTSDFGLPISLRWSRIHDQPAWVTMVATIHHESGALIVAWEECKSSNFIIKMHLRALLEEVFDGYEYCSNHIRQCAEERAERD